MRMYPTAIAQLVRLALNNWPILPKPLAHDLKYNEHDLAHCKVCNGAEGSLPFDCPGERMRDTTEELVMQGKVNFAKGQWKVVGSNRYLPENYDHSGAALLALRDKQAYLQSLGA